MKHRDTPLFKRLVSQYLEEEKHSVGVKLNQRVLEVIVDEAFESKIPMGEEEMRGFVDNALVIIDTVVQEIQLGNIKLS
jgi:hypothetical protein